MSYPQSSPAAGPASSPLVGTDPTIYSPAVLRSNLVLGHSVSFLNEGDPTDLNNFKSRYLKIHLFPGQQEFVENPLQQLEAVMKLYNVSPFVFYWAVPLNASRELHVRFDDIRAACRAKKILEGHDFSVMFVTQQQYAVAKYQDPASVNEYEGQVKLTMEVCPPAMAPDFSECVEVARELCTHFGNIRKIVPLNDMHPFGFRIEFDSIDAANRMTQVLSMCPKWDLGPGFQCTLTDCQPWTGPSSTTVSVSEHGALVRGHFPHRHPNDQHNRVRRDRIVDGSDIRTTVMLRNIPNKMDWLALKDLLDKYCFGTYDFLYLRIDFKTGCNVGYAFINFVDTEGMIAMIDQIEHRNFSGFRSLKAAEISYATIQGKESLVSKFRNSSVMQESPYCRPRLFHSMIDTMSAHKPWLAGTEIAFPAPDNLSKLSRSMESARSTGLYPPNGGGHVDHRSRQGQYDNGNPRDQLLSPELRAAIEFGYHCCNNFVWVPFKFIPRDFVQRFIQRFINTGVGNAQWAGVPASVGVIGQPTNVQYGTPAHQNIGTHVHHQYGAQVPQHGAPPTVGHLNNVFNNLQLA